MKTLNRNKLTLIASLGFGLLALGCGSSDTAIAPSVSATTPNTGVVNGLLQCNNPNFITECGCKGGTVVRTGDVNVCRINITFSPYYSSFSSYSSSNYGYFNSTSYGVQVEAGDRLLFNGSGGYGTVDGPDYDHWGPFYWYTYSSSGVCEVDINLDGKRGSTTVDYGGYPAGLLGAIGEEVFLIGDSYNDLLEQSGIFRYGLNLEVDPTALGMCQTIRVTRFEIRHCENAAGQTIACPAI